MKSGAASILHDSPPEDGSKISSSHMASAFGTSSPIRSLLLHLQMLWISSVSVRFDARIMVSKQQMGFFWKMGFRRSPGTQRSPERKAVSTMRSNELEHTAELPNVQEYDCGVQNNKTRLTSTKAQIHCSFYAEPTGEGEEESNRKERV